MSKYYEDVGYGYVDSGARIRNAETRRQQRRQVMRNSQQKARQNSLNKLKQGIRENPDAIDFNAKWGLQNKEILELHRFINGDANYAKTVGIKFLTSKLVKREVYRLGRDRDDMSTLDPDSRFTVNQLNNAQHDDNAKATISLCKHTWEAETVVGLLTNPQCPGHIKGVIYDDESLVNKLTPEMIQEVVQYGMNEPAGVLRIAHSALVPKLQQNQRNQLLIEMFAEKRSVNLDKAHLKAYKLTQNLSAEEEALILTTVGKNRDAQPLADAFAARYLSANLDGEDKTDALENAPDVVWDIFIESEKMVSKLTNEDIHSFALATNNDKKLWDLVIHPKLHSKLNQDSLKTILNKVATNHEKLIEFAKTDLVEKLDDASVNLLFDKLQSQSASYAYELRDSKLIDRASPEQITELFNNLKKTPQAIDTIVSCKLIQKLGKEDIQTVLNGLDKKPQLDNKILSAVVRSTAMSQVLDSMTIEQADKINKRIEGKRNGWDKRYNVFVAKDLTAKAQKEVNALLEDCPDQRIKDKITADFQSLSEQKILSTPDRTAKEEAHDITVYLETTQKKLTAIADYCDKQKVSKREWVKEAIQVVIGKIIPLKRFASWRSTEKTTNLTKKYKIYKMRDKFKRASRDTKKKVESFAKRIRGQKESARRVGGNAGWTRR